MHVSLRNSHWLRQSLKIQKNLSVDVCVIYHDGNSPKWTLTEVTFLKCSQRSVENVTKRKEMFVIVLNDVKNQLWGSVSTGDNPTNLIFFWLIAFEMCVLKWSDVI